MFINCDIFPLAVNDELFQSDRFTWIPKKADEDEHSIEMHLPYIAKVMEEYDLILTL